MAHAIGVDRALDEAVEEALVRALRSPAIMRALQRAFEDGRLAEALESEEAALAVRRALDSPAAHHVWAEVLASSQAQMLVERIAQAPEVRAAIAEQGAGLITDVGIRLTRLTEALDDAIERLVRRRNADSETDQAGLATRAVAAAVDAGLLVGAYSIVSGLLASVIPFVFGSHLTLASGIALGVLGFLAAGGILVSFWALAGQTPGMRFLSIRLLQNGSREITLGCALRRLFGLLLALAPFGLGYVAMMRDPARRGWHDRIAGTEVVYDRMRRVAPYSRRVTRV